MYPLAKSFFDLALLRLAPQQLPASGFLLSLVVVLFLLIETFGYHITVANWRVSFIVTIVDIGLMALFAKAVLDLSSHSGRLFKTLVALYGAGCIVQFLSIPFVALFIRSAAAENYRLTNLSFFALLFFAGWQVLVNGHIYRHALNTKLGWGIIIALAFQVMSLLISIPLLNPIQEGAT